jgi:hypothetical protein
MKLLKLILASIIISLSLGTGVLAAPGDVDGVNFDPATTDVNRIGGCQGDAADSPVCQDIQSTDNPLFGPDGVLTSAAGIFGIVTGVIAVFMMLIGGLRYINSGGDPQKTSTAKKTIIYASVGVAVAAIGGVLVRFILSQLT